VDTVPASNVPLHLLLVGERGSGRATLAQSLSTHASTLQQDGISLQITTTSTYPVSVRVDLIVFLVDLTNPQALSTFSQHVASTDPMYLFQRSAVLVTHSDEKSKSAWNVTELEQQCALFDCAPKIVDLRNPNVLQHVAEQILLVGRRVCGAGRRVYRAQPTSHLLYSTLDSGMVTVTRASAVADSSSLLPSSSH
jgi:hypothetical protein